MIETTEQWLLANNVEHLQRVLDRARLGSFEHDMGAGIVRVSPLTCELYGIELRTEVPLEEFISRIHPDDLPSRDSSYRRAMSDPQSGFYEVEYRVGPPTYARWLQVRGRIVYSTTGAREPLRVVGVVSDVTEQKSRQRHFESMEAMLEAIGASTDAFIYAKDTSGRVIYCNEAVLRSVGRSRAEVVGHTDPEFLGPGPETDAIVRHDQQVLRDRRAFVFTESLEKAGKKFLSTKTPFCDSEGKLIGLAGVSIDITELEQARLTLAEVEERAAMAAEAAEVGIYDWDPRSNRLVWSDALRRQFGLDLAQEVTLETAMERIHPDDRARVADAVRRAMDPGGDGRYNIEYRTVPVGEETRWLHVLGRVRFEERGGRREATRFFGVSFNITRQKQLDEDLRFQLDLTRNIAENATTAIFMMDHEGRCTFMNPAAEKMFGHEFPAVRGRVLHDLIHHHHPDGRPYPVHECPIDRALPEDFDVVAHEDVFVRKSGEFFPVVVNAKPIRKHGRAVGTVIEVRDVTVERESIQRLRELTAGLADADRRKDEFLATLAHELRNPLSPIRTTASLLTSGKLGPDQLAWAARVIDRQVGHMAKLLDDLLDVARITRGKLTIERRPSRLSEIVEAAVEAARPLIDEKQHQFVVDIAPGDVNAWVDPFRVSQILSNLLTNAARYTPPRGRIEVRSETCGQELVLAVSDNGPGLEADELTRVFEMFSQGRAGAGASGGLGIGLALSRALAQLHGGDLVARSGGAGEGSTFELRLPDALCRAGDAQQSAQRAASSIARAGVLLADDNRDAVDSLALMMRGEGHDVRVAYDGRGAIELARRFRPLVVVLDIGMPDITGYEVARVLRREPWARHALLVALTGWGQQADKELARSAGFDSHLTKPADPAELLALVAEWAQRRSGSVESGT